jgi:adenylate kinase family enzyme
VHPGGKGEGPNSTNAPARLNRVVVLGTTGSGKSTVAAALAARNGAQHIELDGLNHGPNWTQVAVEQFLSRVEELSAASKWVFDGNYIDRVSRTLWPLADTIVWLDLPLTVILLRIVRRTVERILRRTRLWNGNRERWAALFGRNSLLSWAVTSQRRHVTELPVLLADLAAGGTVVVRLRSGRQANRWLAQLPPVD